MFQIDDLTVHLLLTQIVLEFKTMFDDCLHVLVTDILEGHQGSQTPRCFPISPKDPVSLLSLLFAILASPCKNQRLHNISRLLLGNSHPKKVAAENFFLRI